MLDAVTTALGNLISLFGTLIYRIFHYNQSSPTYSLYQLKFIFGFLIAISVVFMAIKLIKKGTWGK